MGIVLQCMFQILLFLALESRNIRKYWRYFNYSSANKRERAVPVPVCGGFSSLTQPLQQPGLLLWVTPWVIIPLPLLWLGWEGEEFPLTCTSSRQNPTSDNRRGSRVIFSVNCLLSRIIQCFLSSILESRLGYSVWQWFLIVWPILLAKWCNNKV